MTPEPSVRDHLVLALDVGALDECEALARKLAGWFSTVKVGLELYAEAGPEAVARLRDQGFRVFADLKLHDIPNTVGRAARVLGRHGVDFLNFHAAGGEVMLRAGVEGFAAGALAGGLPPPKALAVTILTSEGERPPSVLAERVAAAVESGCAGIVCSAHDLHDARLLAPRMLTVVPGIRPEGVPAHDQAAPVTPRAALDAGADILVIGRAVTAADDPAAAAAALVASI